MRPAEKPSTGFLLSSANGQTAQIKSIRLIFSPNAREEKVNKDDKGMSTCSPAEQLLDGVG